jgi:hypothetical protein
MTDLVPYQQQSSFELLPSALTLAEHVSKTEFVPSALRGKPDAVLACILSGHELGIGPMMALKQVHIIEGRAALSAELMRALVLREGHDIWFEETSWTIATIVGRRKGSTGQTRVTFTMDDAKRAKLDGKQNWQRYPRAMLMARATGELCRAQFPDVIAGFGYTQEEVEDGFDLEPEPDEEQPPSGTVKRSVKKRAGTRKAAAKKSGGGGVPVADAPPVGPPLPGEDDDEIVDAEIVEDDDDQVVDEEAVKKRSQQIVMKANAAGVDWHELIHAVTNGRITSSKQLEPGEAQLVFEELRRIKVGERALVEDDDTGLPVLVDVEVPGSEAPSPAASDSGQEVPAHEWDADAWRRLLKAQRVKVIDLVRYAAELAAGDDFADVKAPGNLDDLASIDNESFVSLVHVWVLEQGGES